MYMYFCSFASKLRSVRSEMGYTGVVRRDTSDIKIKSLTDNCYIMYVWPVYNDNIRIVLDRATACIPYSADLTEPAIVIC